MKATYIIPNELIEIISMKRDRYGVTMVKVLHYDGRFTLIPRNQLLTEEDHKQLQELGGILGRGRIGKNKRYFELMKELMRREAPTSLLPKYIKDQLKTRNVQLQFNFEGVS
ncbi:hypothetical protein [Paenibacillus sp. IITD108]|uniref:hypothetical protein n=1 Tax=Paenibacillus sp. IITD108 TaxID=3116649 RepID=UPI002F3E95FE